MISFTCDYNEGGHPEILRRLAESNMIQEPGYGEDSFSISAKNKIKEAIGRHDANVFFLVGGTQTNSTVIDASIPHYGAVIATQSGHIAVHESGAVEFCGHKSDGLYLKISRHAIDMAIRMKRVFAQKKIPLFIDSPTNQQFPILTQEQMDALDGKILYEVWKKLPDGRAVTRFATSWATEENHIAQLSSIL